MEGTAAEGTAAEDTPDADGGEKKDEKGGGREEGMPRQEYLLGRRVASSLLQKKGGKGRKNAKIR